MLFNKDTLRNVEELRDGTSVVRGEEGLILLPEGYEQPEAITVDAWTAIHPDSLYELVASP